MIKDRAVSAIIEDRLRHNKKNNGRKSAVGPKSRRGALPSLSVTDDNIYRGNEDRHFGGRGDAQGISSIYLFSHLGGSFVNIMKFLVFALLHVF